MTVFPFPKVITFKFNGQLSEISDMLIGKSYEYEYEKVLASNSKLVELLKTYKGKMQSKVSDLSISIVSMNELTKQDEEDIKNELLVLDIPASWIENRDIKNMYMAKQIIDRYDFQVSLSPQNKKDLYMMILGTTTLTKNYHYGNLSILMKNITLIMSKSAI